MNFELKICKRIFIDKALSEGIAIWGTCTLDNFVVEPFSIYVTGWIAMGHFLSPPCVFVKDLQSV